MDTVFSGPEGGDSIGDFIFKDFDETLVFVDDFLLGFDLRDDLVWDKCTNGVMRQQRHLHKWHQAPNPHR